MGLGEGTTKKTTRKGVIVGVVDGVTNNTAAKRIKLHTHKYAYNITQ